MAAISGTFRTVGRPGLLVVSAAVLLAIVALLVPFGYVLSSLVTTGWSNAVDLIFRPRVGELLLNTVGLVVVTVPLCVALGVGLAWAIERTDLPGAAFWGPLFAAPLAVPAFVNSYAWISTIPSLHGLWSGVLVATLSYFPLVYLPAAATMRRLDPAVEESARALGSSALGVFLRVVLPQLRLAMLGGGLLIGLHLLAEYGAFQMLRFDTFTVAIFEQYQSTYNGSAGSMLANVLVLCCLVLLIAEASGRGRARYYRVGSGAARPPVRIHLRLSTVPVLLGLLGVAILALGVPLWTIARWLRIGGSAVWDVPAFSAALGQTLGFAVAGAAITTLLAFPVAWVAVRSSSVFARTVEGANYITASLPGIVTALALATVTIHYARPLYQTVVMVVTAYVLMFLPQALVSLRSGLAQVPIGLEEASRSLGKAGVATFVRVTARLMAPSAAAGAALVFVAVTTELTATLLLAPTGTQTLSTAFWSFSYGLDFAGAAPYALIMIVLTLPVTYVLFTQSRKLAAA